MVNSTLHIGGAEQVAACLVEHIDRSAFDVSACYLKEAGVVAEQMSRAGVLVEPIPGLKPGRRDYLTSLKLRKIVRHRQVEVIHTHDIHGLIDGAVCRLMARGLRHVHTFHYGNYPYRSPRLRFIEKALWRVPDVLVTVSHAQAEAICSLYRIPADRMRVIWNGVPDIAAARPGQTETLDIPLGVPVIASISTLIPQKGLEYLIDAAALLQQSGEKFLLLIVGGGPLYSSLMAQAARLQLREQIRFLNWVPQASSRILPLCDIFVQSSLWEAMSVVVLEAMAASKPMVVTSVGENPLVVVPGETGLVVPAGRPIALADGLRTLLRDAGLRERMGRAGRSRYQNLFTVQHMLSAYQDLYRELSMNSR